MPATGAGVDLTGNGVDFVETGVDLVGTGIDLAGTLGAEDTVLTGRLVRCSFNNAFARAVCGVVVLVAVLAGSTGSGSAGTGLPSRIALSRASRAARPSFRAAAPVTVVAFGASTVLGLALATGSSASLGMTGLLYSSIKPLGALNTLPGGAKR